ncbi:hypothetical protein MOB86_14670 [Bacillus haynesii]|uniref:hypothetical protein n=1 Tax=Bacillus haynesii TaxID=1925021 RepID=UPI00227DFE36|nr:hypothetical protein [Bacillus haynesii]MCY8005444.1 hypothetical protein [Bacillus haynesii]
MSLFKKSDELEKHQTNVALKIVFSFYNLSLLVWTIYDYIKTKEMGISFAILCIAQVIFFSALYIQKNRIENLEK